MSNAKKGWLELAIQLLSIGGGYLTHLAFHRWDIALVVTLALECFLHFVLLFWLYRHVLDRLYEWTQDDNNPLPAFQKMVSDIRYVRANIIPLRHVLPGPRDWPFDELFVQVVNDFTRHTHLIAEGSYTLFMEDIQDVSLKVCDEMEPGAFCTALEENLEIFYTARGSALRDKQYEAAKRLSEAHKTRYGFTRLFLLNDLRRVRWQHFQLMKENTENTIEVLVAERMQMESIFRRLDLQKQMDFGKWKRNLLMEIIGSEKDRRLHVTKKDDDIRKVDLLIRELRSAAYSYDEFTKIFKSGINVRLWSTEPETALRLDVPDGPHQTDCETLLRLVSENKNVRRLAIYGLTQGLIDAVDRFATTQRGSIDGIDVVDARYYAPTRKSHLVQFVQANWLDWLPIDYKYDAIVADDVLCNLTIWQTPLFFDHVAKVLNPGGLFAFRTTAKFSPGLVNPTWDDFISEIKQFDNGGAAAGLSLDLLTAGTVYEAAWPTLHTERFYDDHTRSLSFGAWNDAVKKESGISVNLKNRLTFSRPLVLTSMEYKELRSMWTQFRVAQAELPAYSRWENDPALSVYKGAKEIGRRFHEYYRLVLLQKAGA